LLPAGAPNPTADVARPGRRPYNARVITTHAQHPNLHVFTHPLVRHKLTQARDVRTDSADFRRLLHEIASLMAFHVCGNLHTRATEVQTPLETMTGQRLDQPVTLVPILRAGLGMTDGILSLIPEARVGHIGLYRDEQKLRPVPYYCKLPHDIAQGPVLLIDPMVATGNSAVHAAARLREAGCKDIRMVCLVCVPEGVTNMYEQHPDIPLYTAALDRGLDERGYILPGLGDAGDRLFGTR
jgi:uracil phosphoribosyltransferase